MSGIRSTSQCRGCGERIGFIKTKAGKTMPVNLKPMEFIPAGGPNTYVMEDGTVQRGRERDWADTGETSTGYISHFATCPEADRFRKRGNGK